MFANQRNTISAISTTGGLAAAEPGVEINNCLPPVPFSPDGLLQDLPASPTHNHHWPWGVESPRVSNTMPGSKKPWPKISIVTPSYNQGEFIEETIRSVLLQNYPNLEYIVMDGGSTDETLSILKKYERWISLWRSETDRGQTHAINKGFDQASGVIRGYLNSDDLLAPGALEKIALLADNYPDQPIMIMGDCDMCYSTQEVFRRWHPVPPTSFVSALGSDGLCPQPATFWTDVKGGRPIRFNESLAFSMDFEFWCQLIRFGFKPVRLSECLAFYRHHLDAKGATLTGTMWAELAGLPLMNLEKVDSFEDKLNLVKSSQRRTRHYLRLNIEQVFEKQGRRPALRALINACWGDPSLLAERPTLGLARKLILARGAPKNSFGNAYER